MPIVVFSGVFRNIFFTPTTDEKIVFPEQQIKSVVGFL